MDNDIKKLKFLRRVDYADFIADQTVAIGAGGGSVDVTDIPVTPNEALEVEIEGRRYILLAYTPKA